MTAEAVGHSAAVALGQDRRPPCPTAAASARRASVRDTRRTSPPRPSSPITAQWRDTARSLADPAMARATARSVPGSARRIPPATLTNTSCLADGDVGALRQDREQQMQAVEVEARTPSASGTRIARPTASACTSTAIGRSPSQVMVSTLPRGTERRRVEHAPARRGEVAHAIALHGEQPHLACRPEAILDAAEHPVLAEALPLEIQDHVDHVLEGPRPGDGPLLGDMTDEEHRHAGGSWRRRSCAARRREPGRRYQEARGAGVAQGLHGVDHRQRRALAPRWWRSRCRRRTRRAGEPWHRYSQAAELAAQAAQATPRRCSTAPVTPHRRSCATSAARWWTSRCQGHHRAARRCRERSPSQDAVNFERTGGRTRAGAAMTASIAVVIRGRGRERRLAPGDAHHVLAQAVPGRACRAAALPLRRLGSALGADVVQSVDSALQARWPWATHPNEQMYARSSEYVRA